MKAARGPGAFDHRVVISSGVLALVVDSCRDGHPREVCGLIGGRDGRLSLAVAVANVAEPAPGACGFLMDSREQLRAMRAIEEAGLELTGVYHSHPRTPPVPSEGDVRLAAYPEAVHVIVSLVDPGAPEVRAWRIADGRAAEVELEQPR